MIVFTNPIDIYRVRMAYNNDVLNFYSTLPGKPKYCDLTFNNKPMRIYPAPDGTFFLNLKPYVTSYINTRNFEDTLTPNLEGLNTNSYVYNFENGSYFNTNLYFTIWMNDDAHDDNGYNLTWISGAHQLDDYNRRTTSDYFLLSPNKANSTQHYYLKYWEGYPFDVSLFMPNFTYFYLKNTTTALSVKLPTKARVSRLVFSDGRTDETLESLFPLVEGFNEIRFKKSTFDYSTDKFITLEKVPYKKGVYLKWLNNYGGYSYWLFENTYSIDRSTQQIGELDRDYFNLENSFGRTTQIGKESMDTLKITAELLNDDERRIVQGILESPKVYLFTGKPLSQNGKNNWMEVTLKTSNARIKNPKQQLTNFTFDIELPQRYTITL
ncbi:hypothetical protein FUA48_11140 [Flavobacterium alkalisoli]|uniref:Uncharacterized protein n=1 Tax=Flavobacterium alkalisoli TaxID=2602769 RepID=A0A5B9FTF0_9FLAO|nr:hypothetical protein [Flavobacterium alkalisoli]QEE50114.1 hypothetical protein FUA48_11140 [Flavobacterium alkalisoli]